VCGKVSQRSVKYDLGLIIVRYQFKQHSDKLLVVVKCPCKVLRSVAVQCS